MSEKFTYFLNYKGEPWNYQWAFIASTENDGFLIKSDGRFYSKYPSSDYSAKLRLAAGDKPVALKQALKFVFNEQEKEKLIKFFDYKPIEITLEIEEKIKTDLISLRAFNEDSALEIDYLNNEFEIYESLTEKNIIQCYDKNKFYISRNKVLTK